MLSHVVEPGGTALGVTSSAPLVSAHAFQGGGGNVNVLLVNKDPANSYTVTVSVPGSKKFGLGDVFTYGENSWWVTQSATPVLNSSFTVTVAPYSLAAVRVR
jgi:hypothetical protein